jgi:adenine deaminase
MKQDLNIRGRLVDIHQERIYRAALTISGGKITSIEELDGPGDEHEPFICQGFIDAHVHIESSMLVPSEFARLAVVHGTVATISDPHEIANVCGMQGVKYMIRNGKQVPFYFYFGAPSCVPATSFETAGATLSPDEVAELLNHPDIHYLSEMMNFPGVLHSDPEVLEKIKAAQAAGKPVDGHAPGLRGVQARAYIDAGISTDHECFTKEEALDKLNHGMKILIREGSAAKNFDALIELLTNHPEQMMFCSDDKHPDSLVEGHINELCARAIKAGIPLFNILKAACLNPVNHYHLQVGQLRKGDPADFILLNDLIDFRVAETYIQGEKVASQGKSFIKEVPLEPINHFVRKSVSIQDLRMPLNKWGQTDAENFEQVRVIEALDGQLITSRLEVPITDFEIWEDCLQSNPEVDLLKMVVINRYLEDAPAAKCFVRNFGLKGAAIASSVAHDSHNIIATNYCKEPSAIS